MCKCRNLCLSADGLTALTPNVPLSGNSRVRLPRDFIPSKALLLMLQCCSNCRGLYSKTPLIFDFICLYHRCLPQVTKCECLSRLPGFPVVTRRTKDTRSPLSKPLPSGCPSDSPGWPSGADSCLQQLIAISVFVSPSCPTSLSQSFCLLIWVPFDWKSAPCLSAVNS